MSAVWLVGLGAGLTYLSQKRGISLLDSTVLDAKEEELRDENVPDEHIPTKKIRRLQSLPHHNQGSGDTDQLNPDLPPEDVERMKQLATLRRLSMQNGIAPAASMRGADTTTRTQPKVEVSGMDWNGNSESKWS